MSANADVEYRCYLRSPGGATLVRLAMQGVEERGFILECQMIDDTVQGDEGSTGKRRAEVKQFTCTAYNQPLDNGVQSTTRR